MTKETGSQPAQAAYQALCAVGEGKPCPEAVRQQVLGLLDQCGPPHAQLSGWERALIGASYVRAGMPERGMLFLSHAWDKEPQRCAGLAGSALLSLGALGPALPALQHAANDQAAEAAILVNYGRALLLTGQSEEALAWLRRGLAANPANTLAILSVAEALLALGRAGEALSQIPSQPDAVPLLIARVHLLCAVGQHQQADEFLRDARQRFPDSADLLLFSAEFAELKGRMGEAISILKRALTSQPDDVVLLVHLARCGRKGQLLAGARVAADRALELARSHGPDIQALAQSAHAHVLAEEGHRKEAEQTYRDLLQSAPGHLQALSGLGHLLLEDGNVGAAMECFHQVRAVSPLQGWIQLIQAREIPDDPQVLEDMESAARQPGLEGPVRASLLFTVAAAWDKKKDYDRAMRLATEANQASRKLLTYQPQVHRQRVEREMARFSREFMHSRAGWGHPSRVPVFVLGMPRSGTTLTEQILASHTRVFGAGELGLVAEQITRLHAWEQHVGSHLAYPDCVPSLSRDKSRKLAEGWLARLQAFDPSAQHVIDKLPHNFVHIGLIKLLFPNAIIFHCRRESRDIAVSNYITDYAAKFGGMGFAYDLGWIGEQLVDHDRLMQHWHAVFPGQIMEVVYEDLVEDTEHWARRMIAFMGLDWEPGVLDFQGLERPVRTASAWQVRQPVYKTSKERWRRYAGHLDPLEKALAVVPPMPDPLPLDAVEPDLFERGMACLRAKQLQQAEQTFLRILAFVPEHAAAHHFLGVALLQMGKARRAVRAMRHSVKLLPVHPTWFENLARAEHAAGDDERTRKAWAYGQFLRQGRANAKPDDSPA